MARTALPPSERKLRGNAGKRKSKVASIPATASAPAVRPPSWLVDPVAVEEWVRVTPELLKMRILTQMDHTPLAMYCQAFATWVSATQRLATEGHTYTTKSKHGEMDRLRPEVKLADAAERSMQRYGAQFGLGPLARTRVAAGHLQVGQQLPLPGFETTQPAITQGQINAAAEAPKDDAVGYFGYN